MDCTRMFREKKFYTAIFLGFAGILLGSTWPEIEKGKVLACGTFLELVKESLKSQTVIFLIPITAVLPCGEEYLREKQGNFLRFLIIRRSKKEYCCDKVLTTALSGALVWLAASVLGVLFFFLLFFAHEEVFQWQKDVITELLTILGRTCLVASSLASLSAAIGIVSSSVYLAFGLPFVAYYSLIILRERYFKGLYCIDPSEWVMGLNNWAGAQRGLWMFLLFLTMGLAVLHWVILEHHMEEI